MLTQPTTDQNDFTEQDDKAQFLQWLPRIERQLRHAFCHLNPEACEEAVQEGIVNCYCAFRRLHQQGKGEQAYASSLARYAIRHIRCGRQVGCQLNAQEPLSRYAQQKNGIRTIRGEHRPEDSQQWLAALVEDRRTSVPDQVALRIDVSAWLGSLKQRIKAIADDLAIGRSTSEVAHRHRLSSGRISQIRRELYDSWNRFQADKVAIGAAGDACS